MQKLIDTTNSNGYVSFPNALVGIYTISIKKQGYAPMNQTFTFTASMPTLTLTITQSGNNSGIDPTLIWLIIIVIIVVIVIVAVAYLQKRRTAAKFKVPKKWAPPEPPKF
jgi:tellurite resistance protein TehA-like permease